MSVGQDGCVWAINDGVTGSEGTIYQRTGIRDDLPEGDGWDTSHSYGTMKFRWVSVGVCQIFAINLEHEIYKRIGCTMENAAGTDWIQFGGELI